MDKWKNETTKFYYCQEKAKPPKFIEHDIKDYHWAMFKHVMEFLKQCSSFKKTTPKVLFY
jgi:hypothetical protein